MRKIRSHNQLRKLRVGGAVRAAFSLVELVVSMGVLVVLLAVAGEVMNLTVESTSQARALIEVTQQLRIFERTLRADLAGIDRERSVLVIHANPINAYWTSDGRDADDNGDPVDGYPHARDPERGDRFEPEIPARPRADVLMFFTARAATSANDSRITAGLQQVVYGHADLGEYTPDGSTFELLADAFPADPDEVSPIPAEGWILARRNVLLSPSDPADPNLQPRLGEVAFLTGEQDVAKNFVYADRVLTPAGGIPGFNAGNFPMYLPMIFNVDTDNGEFPAYERSRLDPTPPPTVDYGVRHYFLAGCASFKVEWTLDPYSELVSGRLSGENRMHWIDPGELADPKTGDQPDPLRSLNEAIEAYEKVGLADQAQRIRELVQLRIAGTADLVSGGGLQDELYSLEERFGMAAASEWLELADGERPNVAAFTAARRNPAGEIIPEDVFPAALRITLDMIDPLQRLDRPIRHVIVVPVGGA